MGVLSILTPRRTPLHAQVNDREAIMKRLKEGKDPLGRGDLKFTFTPYEENDYLPRHYEMLVNMTSR
jgi:hypothetical protein